MVALSFASLLVRDIDRVADYYRSVFGLTEVDELASPHFRGLRLGGTILGFSGPHAYELLKIERPTADHVSVHSFLTFETEDTGEVDRLTARALECGGTLVSEPGDTYYGAWQSVLADPEGNVFRINHLKIAAPVS
jgi:catechol 2,3-dioxygenase-like lactoylglutathione lyase family enzyme